METLARGFYPDCMEMKEVNFLHFVRLMLLFPFLQTSCFGLAECFVENKRLKN